MLKITNLTVSYASQQVLANFNLEVKSGSFLGILGKNGAGKTTLFNSIYQNIKYHGSITFNRELLSKYEVAYLESENYFYPYITGAEYLNYFTSANPEKFDLLITQFDIPLDKYVQDYSSGMKKKLALIGMLLLDYPINILDEPFNGVDFEGVNFLYDIIKDLKENNKIVIISSHIIETLFHTCDKIAILKDGNIQKIYDKSDFKLLENFSF